MDRRGELHDNSGAPEGPELGADFWEKAVLVAPNGSASVNLEIEPDVLDYFRQGGKGHLTRMQNVLKDYVAAQKARKTG